MESLSTVGQRVREMRKKQGISQEKLAKVADVSVRSISLLEQGIHRDLRGNTLRRIARVLDCTVDYLVGLELNEKDVIPGSRQGGRALPGK